MDKTRKERINTLANKKMVDQFKQSQMRYKRGTAVLSTTLLIGLLAFPSISVSATANELANASNKKLENTKEVTETTNESFEEVETGNQEKYVLSEDETIEKEQKINELKRLLSETEMTELNFEELTVKEIDELFIEALANSNDKSISLEELPQEENLNLAVEVEEEKETTTYKLNEEEKVNEDEEKVAESPEVADEEASIKEVTAKENEREEIVTEVRTSDKVEIENDTIDKLAAEKLASEKAAAEKLADEKVATEAAAAEKLAAEKLAAEKAASAKKLADEKVATEAAAAEKLAAEKAASAKKLADEKVATEAAAAEKLAAEKAASAKKLADEKVAIEAAAAEKLAAEKTAAAKKLADEKIATKTAAAKKLADEKAATEKTIKEKEKLAKIYVVKSGDTLNRIAKAHKVSVAELKNWNNLSSNLIHPGDALAVNKAGAQVVKESNQIINSNKGIEKMSNKEFINFIGAYAAEVAPKNNLYASVMVAQAALESGYGGSSLSSSPNHNLFGIKGSYQGQTVTMYTSEYSKEGGWIRIPQNFKKYPSHAESLQDNANLLRRGTNWNSNFYAGAWMSNAKSYADATAWLQGRYATDPSYASKLNKIIRDNNLTRFDKDYAGGHTTPTPVPEVDKPDTSKPDSNTTVSSSYQVKSGDTLWGIATSNHTSVANLKAWNNLKSDTIYVGQKLVIKKAVTTPAPEVDKPDTSKPDSNTTESSSYQVKSGDTLWDIATSNHTSVANLKAWNNLKSDTIYVGQQLVIKKAVTTPTQKPEVDKPDTSKPDSNTTESSSYQVKSGDTLWDIATSNHTSVANLKAWNNLKSDTIYVGQQLVIKKAVTTPTQKPEVNKPDMSKPDSNTTVSSSYQVKIGDTLWDIATSNHVSVANLKSWNNLKSDTIYIGQKLVIKETVATPTQKPEINKPDTSKPDSDATISSSYQVKSGDTLWDIATSNHVSVANLKSWNNLKSDTIYIGRKLVIKETVATPTQKPEINKPDTSKPDSDATISSSYQVKSGDTLWDIATSNHTSVADLKTWNNLKSDIIYIGQKLSFKGSTTITSGNTTIGSNVTTKPTSKANYQVKSGDTLWSIAKEYNLTLVNLKKLNRLSSDMIIIGQKLIVQSVLQSEPVKEKDNTTKMYKVLSGDSLWSIAQKLNTSVAKLKESNHLKTDIIFVGQSILIK